MAYQRASDSKIKGDSLDAFVENISKAYTRQIALRNGEDESKFNTMVLESNLSLDEQLSYRKEQLNRVKDDPAERKRVREEIANLTDRVEQKKFGDAYLEKLITFESGLSSIDSVISWLQDQKNATTDQTIKNAIQKSLVENQSKKYELTKQLIANQTDYALKDKTADVIDAHITKVTAEKNKALLAGNEQLSSIYDLQLQALSRTRDESAIENDMKNFAVATVTGFSSAVKLLDSYNAKVASAPAGGTVTIGGVTYANAKEFWTYKRDSYVADNSEAGFFGRLNNETTISLKVQNSKNNLDLDTLRNTTKTYDTLAGRPELAGYETKITVGKQDAIQTGTDFVSDKIINTYAVDYDLNKAISNLTSLKGLGANVDNAYTKIITSGAQVKQGQITNILEAAKTAMQNDPNLTPEQAISSAVATGAAIVRSPEELAATGAEAATKEFAKGAVAETFKEDERLTVQPSAPEAQPQPATEQPIAQEQIKTITVKPGETLSQIAARELGSASKFNEIAALNNIADPNVIQSGAILKIPSAGAQAPAPQPTSTQSTATIVQPTTPTPQPPKPTYSGSSIEDYLSSIGQDPSFQARAKRAKEKGIQNYTGEVKQNLQLLKTLRGF